MPLNSLVENGPTVGLFSGMSFSVRSSYAVVFV